MYYRNESDETLVFMTLAGEQSAYEALVFRYQKTVIAAAVSITHNQYMAEDAAQDAFVTAWMKLNTLQNKAKFSAWVCKIAKNCAMNMVMRLRSFLPLETVENLNTYDSSALNPSEAYASSEERDELHKSIEKLPNKVRTIINLHYFEGLSITEIADRMRISSGTVKWQLHDGRKRIRKELCAMNEKYGDTLVQRVMKKVEELKLWQYKNDKSGFETVYRDVLREVEDLPESDTKKYALADVLLRGWWWLPGEKNDAMLKRLASSAIEGRNEEAMTFIVAKEDSAFWGSVKTDFIRNKQIPRLENAGFKKALGHEWFWLGYYCFKDGECEKGDEAYLKAREILSPGDALYDLIPYARRLREALKGKNTEKCFVKAASQEYRRINGGLKFWKKEYVSEGELESFDYEIGGIFGNSSFCDCSFFADINLGETYIGTDGSTLTFASDSETVEAPAGLFENCQLWITRRASGQGGVFKSYYKDGVGIVKYEHIADGVKEAVLLASFNIAGGTGLLPVAEGNRWEYASEHPADVMQTELVYEVSYSDDNKVMLVSWENVERLKYDENSWLDTVQQIASEYINYATDEVCDVTHAVERAELLAKTPAEKAHTKAAASVARRIMSASPAFNPDRTARSLWDFFERGVVENRDGCITLSDYNCRLEFEYKNVESNNGPDAPLLFNDIFGILQDGARCIWSDEWLWGTLPIVEYRKYDSTIKTQITCEKVGAFTVKAGTFDNCIKLNMEIVGLHDGLSYRSGKKVYYFADGIGIIRTENDYFDGAMTAVYELTAYEGTGDGYMPIENGMLRRYDALDLTDGYEASAEYTYVTDENGETIIFADRMGIRKFAHSVTDYDSIQGEIIEANLWDAGKFDESRLRHDVNNFNLLCHFLGRENRNWAAQEKASEWSKYRMQIIEGLGENGEIPDAWLGHYSSSCFRTACALFGCGKKDAGYEYLEKAFDLFSRWEKIKYGDEMDVGKPLIYGGIKVVKGSAVIKLPNGEKEPLKYSSLFNDDARLMYYGMTAPHGWEWFNSVRNEERFKSYIARAKALFVDKG